MPKQLHNIIDHRTFQSSAELADTELRRYGEPSALFAALSSALRMKQASFQSWLIDSDSI